MRRVAEVNWWSLSPCKPIISSWRESTPKPDIIYLVTELREAIHSAKFDNFWYFEAPWGFLELACKDIRDSSMETSYWDKQIMKSNLGQRLLCIWVDKKTWNILVLNSTQWFLILCLLFPKSTRAPVEPDENEHRSQFSKGKRSHLAIGSSWSMYNQRRALFGAERAEGQAVRYERKLLVSISENEHRNFGYHLAGLPPPPWLTA